MQVDKDLVIQADDDSMDEVTKHMGGCSVADFDDLVDPGQPFEGPDESEFERLFRGAMLERVSTALDSDASSSHAVQQQLQQRYGSQPIQRQQQQQQSPIQQPQRRLSTYHQRQLPRNIQKQPSPLGSLITTNVSYLDFDADN